MTNSNRNFIINQQRRFAALLEPLFGSCRRISRKAFDYSVKEIVFEEYGSANGSMVQLFVEQAQVLGVLVLTDDLAIHRGVQQHRTKTLLNIRKRLNIKTSLFSDVEKNEVAD